MKMFRNIKYFLPTYSQCWVMVFYICAVGGIGVGLAIALAGIVLGFSIQDLNPLVSYIAPMVPVFAYILFKGNEAAAKALPAIPLSNFNPGKASPMAVVLLVAVSTVAAMIVTEPLSLVFPMPEAIKEVYKKMLSDTLWTTLSVAVAAPLIEEFLLRGVMMRGMLQYISPTKAILWSAFFFALIHLNLSQATGAFILGTFIGWIYYRTGSLWLAILIHFINNGLSTLFTIMYPENIEMSLMDPIIEKYNTATYITLYIVSALVLGAIIRYLHKNLNNEQKQETISIQI